MTLLKFLSGTLRSCERKLKTGIRSALMLEVRSFGHMPKILPKSFWWMPLDWRKEMMEWMESRVAVWRDGFRERALPESTPMISRHRIFSLNLREMFEWAGA